MISLLHGVLQRYVSVSDVRLQRAATLAVGVVGIVFGCLERHLHQCLIGFPYVKVAHSLEVSLGYQRSRMVAIISCVKLFHAENMGSHPLCSYLLTNDSIMSPDRLGRSSVMRGWRARNVSHRLKLS